MLKTPNLQQVTLFMSETEELTNTQYRYTQKVELWATQLNELKRTRQTLNWQMRLIFAGERTIPNGENPPNHMPSQFNKIPLLQ